MLENPHISSVKLKNVSKTRSFLPTLTFALYLKKELKFSKTFRTIDLGLHFDLCENESYSIFVAKAGFFYAQKSI